MICFRLKNRNIFDKCMNFIENLCCELSVESVISGKSEVSNFHGLIIINKDVLRFYVTMNYIVNVKVINSLEQLKVRKHKLVMVG